MTAMVNNPPQQPQPPQQKPKRTRNPIKIINPDDGKEIFSQASKAHVEPEVSQATPVTTELPQEVINHAQDNILTISIG